MEKKRKETKVKKTYKTLRTEFKDFKRAFEIKLIQLESDIQHARNQHTDLYNWVDELSHQLPNPTREGTNNYDHDYMRIMDQLIKVTQELRQFAVHSHADGKVVMPFESVLDNE